jgi:predicted RNase H-like HicB family nuclease
MSDYRYIRITYLLTWVRAFSKVYVLQAYLEQDGNHRWNAWIDVLPGCTAWGYTREEALKSLRDAVELYADTGVEAIGEALSKHEIRARRDHIVPLPSWSGCTFSDLWITSLEE